MARIPAQYLSNMASSGRSTRWLMARNVAPMVGGRHANLVVVLKPTAPVSKTLAIDLTYREGGTQYRMQTHYPLLILIGVLRACAGNWPSS